MSINVNRNVDDAFYRYKMPRLVAKVEGKGNGIKTVIANMPEIAKALHRPPTYATKYFGCELGAQTQFDLRNDRYIVNGEHDANKLQELLDGFIRKFVLCQQCENPETTLLVKGSKITLQCIACGHVTNVDPRHKLTTFICKNPPEPESGDCQSTTAGKKTAKGRRTKEAGVENGSAPQENSDEGDAPAMMVENNNNNISINNNANLGVDDEDDVDWSVDPDDVVERQKQLAVGIQSLTFNEDLEKSVDERLDMFYGFLLKKKEAGQIDDYKSIEAEALRLDVKDKAVLLLCRVVFDENMIDQVKTNRALLLRFVYQSAKAQRYLLGGIEQLIVAKRAKLMPKVAHILKAFYDADVLEEDVLLEWGSKASKKYVSKEESKEIRARAEPFLSWLREAEEESGSDSDVEVVYEEKNQRNGVSKTSQMMANTNKGGSNDGDDDDDLNIDDI